MKRLRHTRQLTLFGFRFASGWLFASLLAVLGAGANAEAQTPATTRTNRLGAQNTKIAPEDWSKASLAQIQQAAGQGDAAAQFYLGRLYELGAGLPRNYTEAAKFYRLAAEQGHPMGQNNLGYLCQVGLGVPKDAVEAVKWYRKSTEQGEPLGQCNLGWMYENGQGVEKSREQAELWTRKAAEQGLAAAQFLMGYMAEFQKERSGNTIVGNYQVASEWYQKAAAQGHVKAMFHLGDLYYYGKLGHNHPEAAKWFRLAAEKGDNEAVMRLGELYRDNHSDLPENHVESARWFRIAAEKGNAEAQYRLGCLLVDGKGISHDQAQAESWLRKAAEHGYAEAAVKLAALNKASPDSVFETMSREDLEVASYNGGGETRLTLARAYEDGRGGPVEMQKAAEMYWKILNLGPENDHVEALRRVINLYAQQKLKFETSATYAPKDREEFVRHLQSYTQRVTPPAESLFQVGEMFIAGEMLPKDQKQAVEWLTRAARAGSAPAMNRLGTLWAAGVGGKPDPTEAANWYRKAAAPGFAEAQFNLGRCFAAGDGVPNDPVEAWRWLQAAASQNFPDAAAERDKLQSKMTPEQLTEARRKASELVKPASAEDRSTNSAPSKR